MRLKSRPVTGPRDEVSVLRPGRGLETQSCDQAKGWNSSIVTGHRDEQTVL